jgi:hypothetical protein
MGVVVGTRREGHFWRAEPSKLQSSLLFGAIGLYQAIPRDRRRRPAKNFLRILLADMPRWKCRRRKRYPGCTYLAAMIARIV